MEPEEERKGYKKLRAWQKADELASTVFRAVWRTQTIPPWLREQVCKSALSVPANIAEGYSRGSLADYLRFLDIARGSLGETEYYVGFMAENGLINASIAEKLLSLLSDTGGLLFGLIRSLAQKQKAGTWKHRASVNDEQASYLVDDSEVQFQFAVTIAGRPPLHQASHGISLNNPKHTYYHKAQTLKQAAAEKMQGRAPFSSAVVMEVSNGHREEQGDSASILQAVFTALEGVVYNDDGQIKEVHYLEGSDQEDSYSVTVSPLSEE
ncbi:MAG: four helix bundle protein [Chloroflexi bacterium]|nr:four helix bundle protein [Chloroflexota bacterium]